MIHKIVNDALTQIDQYDVQRREEKFEMMYCLARIERDFGYRHAMLTLNHHLDTHYKPKGENPSLCDTATQYYPHENGIDMLKEV